MACLTNELDNSSIFQGDDIEGYNACPQSNVKIVKVVPLPHARSEVWTYFGFIADDDGEIHDKKKTICRICATTLCYSGNTTNLFTHLKAMHPEVNPQKLAPTNKVPRTGKKSNKRKFCQDSENNLIPIEIDSSPHYIVRNLSFNSSTTPDTESEQSVISTNNHNHHASNLNSSSLTGNTSNANLSQHTVHTTTVISGTSQQNDLLKLNNKSDSGAYILNNDRIVLNNQHEQTNQSQDAITDAIVNLIVRDCRPIDLVIGKHFEKLIKLLAPNYKIPQSDKLEQLVKKKYTEIKREMHNRILRSMDDE